jgi:hypothetical protein
MIVVAISRLGGSCGPVPMEITMVEVLFMAQLVRKPLQAMARRWWCKSLYRASRGQRRCPECTKS